MVHMHPNTATPRLRPRSTASNTKANQEATDSTARHIHSTSSSNNNRSTSSSISNISNIRAGTDNLPAMEAAQVQDTVARKRGHMDSKLDMADRPVLTVVIRADTRADTKAVTRVVRAVIRTMDPLQATRAANREADTSNTLLLHSTREAMATHRSRDGIRPKSWIRKF